MENVSNLIFIAVAMAIFIGRTVVQARKKKEEEKNPPPPPPKPQVQALHFELKDDDEDDIPGYLKKPAAAPVAKVAKQPVKPTKKQPSSLLTKASAVKKKDMPIPANVDKLFQNKGTAVAASSEQSGFSFNLDHLSPMKQAVVMAEILGPPKGMM